MGTRTEIIHILQSDRGDRAKIRRRNQVNGTDFLKEACAEATNSRHLLRSCETCRLRAGKLSLFMRLGAQPPDHVIYHPGKWRVTASSSCPYFRPDALSRGCENADRSGLAPHPGGFCPIRRCRAAPQPPPARCSIKLHRKALQCSLFRANSDRSADPWLIGKRVRSGKTIPCRKRRARRAT